MDLKSKVKSFIENNGFLFVLVKPNKKNNSFISFEDNILVVELNAKPLEGEANKVLLSFFKKEFKDYDVVLKSGFSSRKKKLLFEKKK